MIVNSMEKREYSLTRLDISPTNGLSLDERTALVHFFGKNQEDAATLFEENFGYYAEDLTYMGNKAFFYYLGSVKLYIENHEDEFTPSDYVSIAYDLLSVFQSKKESSLSEAPDQNGYYRWIISFVINNLDNIIQDDNSWIVDPDLISEKKIKSLIRRWGELGYPT